MITFSLKRKKYPWGISHYHTHGRSLLAVNCFLPLGPLANNRSAIHSFLIRQLSSFFSILLSREKDAVVHKLSSISQALWDLKTACHTIVTALQLWQARQQSQHFKLWPDRNMSFITQIKKLLELLRCLKMQPTDSLPQGQDITNDSKELKRGLASTRGKSRLKETWRSIMAASCLFCKFAMQFASELWDWFSVNVDRRHITKHCHAV